jgi:hypothetical protein
MPSAAPRGGAAKRVEDQPEGHVRLSGGKFAAEYDPIAAPFGYGGAVYLSAHMASDLRTSCRSELAGEMPDPTQSAVDQHLASEQQPALAQRVQRGEARNR